MCVPVCVHLRMGASVRHMVMMLHVTCCIPDVVPHRTSWVQMVARFTAQLDDIFGTPSEPKPASKYACKSHVINWAQQPWVRGAYT
jgi:hypothetical protein